MNRRYLNLCLWGVAFGAAFALSHVPHVSSLSTVFDDGRGAGFVVGTPGLAALPSWVFRYAWLLAAALCFAPVAAPVGRGALRLAALCRRELDDWWVAGILGVAAAVAAACLAYFSLAGEGHTWQEREYEFQARILATGRVTASAPPTDELVTPGGRGRDNFLVGANEGVRDGKWFTVSMPAWPLLLAAGTALGRAWLVNAVVAFFTALALFGYGRRVVGADAALVGVFLYALSPFVAFTNASFFAEPTFLLFLVLFLWAYDAGREAGKASLEVVAGILLVLTFGTRGYAALAALPAAALLFYGVARKEVAGPALSYFALGLAVAAAPLIYYNYLTTGDPLTFPASYALYAHAGFSLSSLSPRLIYSTAGWLWFLATDLMGWPLISFVPALVPLFLKKLPPRARPAYLVAAATLVLHALSYGDGVYYGALPAALLGGGLGLTLLPSWLKNKWNVARGTTAAATLLAVAAATGPYFVALEPVHRNHWAFPGGVKPWVSRQLDLALEEWNVKEALIFVAPAERCAGPPPNDGALKNAIIYAHDCGSRNAAFAALFMPRPYLLCDYREFEKTGVIHLLELEPDRRAAERRIE